MNPYESPTHCEQFPEGNCLLDLLYVLGGILCFWNWDWALLPVGITVAFVGPFTCLLWDRVWERHSPAWLLLSAVLTPLWWLVLAVALANLDTPIQQIVALLHHYFPR